MKLQHSYAHACILVLTVASMWLLSTSCSPIEQRIDDLAHAAASRQAADEFARQLPGLTMSDIVAQYDTTNLIGVFQMYDILRIRDLTRDGTIVEKNIVINDQHVQGKLYHPTDNRRTFSLKDTMLFNQIPLIEQVDEGVYLAFPQRNKPLTVYYGSQPNTVTIPATEFFAKQNALVPYSEPVRITSLRYDTVISRSQPMHIRWSGAGKDYIIFSFGTIANEKDGKPSGSHFGFFAANTGSIDISTEQLRTVANGRASLTIRRIEPRFVTLSNRQRIAFIGLSEHSILLTVKD